MIKPPFFWLALSGTLAASSLAGGSQTPIFFPAIESEWLGPWQAASLARSNGEVFGLWGEPGDHEGQWGLAWQNHGFQAALAGPPDALWRQWQLAQGFRIKPGWWCGLTLNRQTALAWRKGLALGADMQAAFGPRLRLSTAIEPRVWNQDEWRHTWGASLRVHSSHAGGRSYWLGMSWPWQDGEAHEPSLLATLQSSSALGLQAAYDFDARQTRLALTSAMGAKTWLGVSHPHAEKPSATERARLEVRRRSPGYAAHLVPQPLWLRQTWDRAWVEGETRRDWLGQEQATGFAAAMQNLQGALAETDVRGLFITLRGWRVDLAMAQEAVQRIERLRAAGKYVVVYADEVTPLALYLGAHATRFIVHPQGYFSVRGFSAELAFYRGTLNKVGLTPQFIRHGRYKAFDEPFMREQASPEYRANTREWVDDLWATYREGVARGRRLDTAALEGFIRKGELNLDSAKAYGLVDTLLSETSALQWAAQGPAKGMAWQASRLSAAPIETPAFSQNPRLAVVSLNGAIEDDGQSLWPVVGEGGFAPKATLALLQDLRRDASVKAVVLRIDSPGGSALASDIMAEALDSLRASGKPVVMSVGGMAASGGYYLATACSRIVAEPASLVGSIGVVWGKVSAESLYTRLGIRHEVVKSSPHADALSTTRPFTEAESSAVQRHLDAFYRTFIARVQKARGFDTAGLDSVAEGRVFLGERAYRNGLVDTLGGLETAMRLAKTLAGYAPNSAFEIEARTPQDDATTWSGSGASSALIRFATRLGPSLNPGLPFNLMDSKPSAAAALESWRQVWEQAAQAWAKPGLWALAPLAAWEARF